MCSLLRWTSPCEPESSSLWPLSCESPLQLCSCHDPRHLHPALHAQHISHDPDVSTVTLRLPEPVSLEGFKTWMDMLLWESDDAVDIFRIKGLLNVEASDTKHGVQVPPPRCYAAVQ